MRSALLALLLLTGCPTGGDPAPVTPAPVEPAPDPAPEPPPPTSACARACAHMAVLHCAAATSDCPDTCDRFEVAGGALAWHPECIETVADCKAAERCRGGD